MKCYVCEKDALEERTTKDYLVIDCQYCGTYKISKILIDLMQGRKFPMHEMRKLLDERKKKLASTVPEPIIETWDEDLLDFEEGDGDKCKAWIADQGLKVQMVSLEYADEAIATRYFESHDADCSYWEPERPEGEGWFCLAIHDTDDGPVCWWARREVTP